MLAGMQGGMQAGMQVDVGRNAGGMQAGMLQPPRLLTPRSPSSTLRLQHRDAKGAAVVQASKSKIKQMNNTELLDMTAELCNSRTALLN